MGGSFIGFSGSGMRKCDGDDVMRELNDTFLHPEPGHPKYDRYKYAMDHNTFDSVKDEAGNYKALILAYLEAGVDVCARWGAYLRELGKTPEGQNDIFQIAQTRYKALTHTDGGHPAPVPMETTYHPGKRVKKHDGTGPNDPSTIAAPFSP